MSSQRDKQPIHTTISYEAMRVLERYEKELGAKNLVIDRALLGMGKKLSETVPIDATISKIKIDFLKELLGGITEGIFFGVIGPPSSGKTLFACKMIHDFLSYYEKQCTFISKRNKISYLVPITSSLGMKFGYFSEEKLFLDICDLDSLDAIFRNTQKTCPKIVVIDDLNMIRENGSNSTEVIVNSSGWNIFSDEVRNKKVICVVLSEDEKIIGHCDVAIKLEKSKHNSVASVLKNIGPVSSFRFILEITDTVRLVPLQASGIEIVNNFTDKKTENRGHKAPEKIADRNNGNGNGNGNGGFKTTDVQIEKIKKIENSGIKIPPEVRAALYGK